MRALRGWENVDNESGFVVFVDRMGHPFVNGIAGYDSVLLLVLLSEFVQSYW